MSDSIKTTRPDRSTQFHHVTYREANALRDSVGHPAATPVGHRFVRLLAVFRSRTPLRGRGVRCRECGDRLGPREDAICFAFMPYATEDDRQAGYIANTCWLHRDPCPTTRVLR